MASESELDIELQRLVAQGVQIGRSKSGSVLRIDCRLAQQPIDDACVQPWVQLTKIRELYLSGSAISDSSMPLLAKLENLKTLDLQQTTVGDHGLQQLIGLSKLELLLIRGTRVSPTCLAEMRRKMIRTRIVA